MDRELILEKIKALAIEAKDCGELAIASSLMALAGSINACSERELSNHVSEFSKRDLMRIAAGRN